MNRAANFDPYRSVVGESRYDAEFERLRALHGDDPATRAQAAAHEAGHAIMAASFGWRLTDIRLQRHTSGKWHGFVNFEHPRANQALRVHEDPELVLASAVTMLGGRAAEQRVGRYHPCGSIGELLYASDTCAQMDEWAEVERGSTLALVEEAAAARLQAYAATFDLLRAHLARTCKLLPTERRRMFQAVTPSPIEFPYPEKKKPATESARA
ncbi:hypothetical protein [Burkholderia ubonensis]|uniref:hypothetical protein n=1 Tax=Burkholderia ubonensis TaxID=101571 RepID=UPI00075E5EC2|nr:hypothetical protein [Burkholderia ubonensis]KVG74308.1 hypothetical protein WJ34_12825 [Burkholderia ubonensis]KVH24892.1 hypothetical protein WJ37_08040 [Burkholderia ubonensis]KVH51673.1 hypothetical protein WJ38_08140 [Burkholderia ubonensis]KVH86156.1 hypothetical protein WJ43_08540 [Burkholderia ubonensis]KVM31973.1 hypothetical protein WJ55_17025 [Burkholderia ubonensis]